MPNACFEEDLRPSFTANPGLYEVINRKIGFIVFMRAIMSGPESTG
jgi:hypothetical protein